MIKRVGPALKAASCFLIFVIGLSGNVAQAQIGDTVQGMPNVLPDELHVNMTNGKISMPMVSMSIGSGSAGVIDYKIYYSGDNTNDGGYSDNQFYFISDASYPDGSVLRYAVNAGPLSKNFLQTGSLMPPDPVDGSSLSRDSGGNFTYTSKNGSVIYLPWINVPCIGAVSISQLNSASTVIKPNGEKITYTYNVVYGNQCSNWQTLVGKRLQSVSSNFGYQLHYDYLDNSVSQGAIDGTEWISPNWYQMTGVTAINQAVDYCDVAAITCPALTQNWPKITVNTGSSSNVGTISDPTGVGYGFGAYIYSDPSSTSGTSVNFALNRNGTELLRGTYKSAFFGLYPSDAVVSFTQNGNTWAYNYPAVNSPYTEFDSVRTDPLGGTRTARSEIYHGNLLGFTDEKGRTTTYLYNNAFLLQYVIAPEGVITSGAPISGYTKFDYDARGNIVQTTKVPKANSGLANIVTTAGFDTTCANPKTCNQPNWVKDALGNETDYAYDPNSGGLLSEMKPAPSAGAARPLTLKTYAQHYAWVKNASGSLVQLTDPVWLIASETSCQTAAGSNTPTCDGSAPQTVTTYQYGASGTGEAMLIKGVAVASGGTTLRTCYGYDIYHNRISETKPNANLGVCP